MWDSGWNRHISGLGMVVQTEEKRKQGSRHAEDGAESRRGMQESLTAFLFPRLLQKPCCILAFVSESECNVMIKSPTGLK